MRIGLICHAGFGGSVRIAVDLAETLGARGHEVHLFSRRPPLGRRRFDHDVGFHGLHAEEAPPSPHLDTDWNRRDLRAFSDLLADVTQDRRIEVLHFHYAVPFAALLDGVVSRLDGAAPALVGTLHGTDVSVYGGHPRRGPRLARALVPVDALTTVSRSHAALAADVFGLGRLPEVIPNFVDVAKFRPTTNGSSRLRPRIVHVSNFRSVKDPERVARVFVRLSQKVDSELWLVGDGELMSAVRGILAGAGVDDRVRHFGLTPRVQDILVRTDLLLLTSRTESFGLVALEAAACGVPTVAPRVGGLPEVVIDGETGLLFDPADEEGAVRATLRLIEDSRLRLDMGEAAASRARSFSRQIVVERYEALYRRLLDDRSSRASVAAPAGVAGEAGA